MEQLLDLQNQIGERIQTIARNFIFRGAATAFIGILEPVSGNGFQDSSRMQRTYDARVHIYGLIPKNQTLSLRIHGIIRKRSQSSKTKDYICELNL